MAIQAIDAEQAQSAVAQRLRRMALVRTRLDGLEAELERELASARRRYEARIEALQRRMEQQQAELEVYCRARRDAVLPLGRKSLVTQFGEVAFRSAEPSVQVREGLGEDDACRLLKAAGLESLVRARESPDKPAVRAALRQGTVTPRALARCGLELVDGEERFHCKLWQDALLEAGRST
jgi:phage host-nuclease inhibitor protein Gam